MGRSNGSVQHSKVRAEAIHDAALRLKIRIACCEAGVEVEAIEVAYRLRLSWPATKPVCAASELTR